MPDNLFSPNKFLSQINLGRQPAKNSLYRVEIFKPIIFGLGGTSLEPLTYLCESAEMPGKSFTTENVQIYGPGYNVPYLAIYQNINLTFLCTNSQQERKIFDLWMNSIINPNSNNIRFQKGKDSNYLSQIQVIQYDTMEKEIYKVILVDAFPTSIAPQQLSWSDDGFQRLTVNFLYQKYQLAILN
jgi:hypothetical protein